MYSEYTQSALEILRHPSETMHWYIIPILLVLIYIISREMHDKHYQVLAGGVALWGMDLFNETWNSMVCFISGTRPCGAPRWAWAIHRSSFSSATMWRSP